MGDHAGRGQRRGGQGGQGVQGGQGGQGGQNEEEEVVEQAFVPSGNKCRIIGLGYIKLNFGLHI